MRRRKARLTVHEPDQQVRATCAETGEILEGPAHAVFNHVAIDLMWEDHHWKVERRDTHRVAFMTVLTKESAL